jgi:hypothetical protein
MIASGVPRSSGFLRELLPQDLQLEVEQLTRGEAKDAARFPGRIIGNAHAPQLDAVARKKLISRTGASSIKAVGCSILALVKRRGTLVVHEG